MDKLLYINRLVGYFETTIYTEMFAFPAPSWASIVKDLPQLQFNADKAESLISAPRRCGIWH